MLYAWSDGTLKISVSNAAVYHAVNVEGYRPLGRKLTDEEVSFVRSKVCQERLLKAYTESPDAYEDNDSIACERVIDAFHKMTDEIVSDMNIE